jgi:hypothetical protein
VGTGILKNITQFLKSSQNSCQNSGQTQNVEIFPSNLNLKVQNIYIKQLLKQSCCIFHREEERRRGGEEERRRGREEERRRGGEEERRRGGEEERRW